MAFSAQELQEIKDEIIAVLAKTKVQHWQGDITQFGTNTRPRELSILEDGADFKLGAKDKNGVAIELKPSSHTHTKSEITDLGTVPNVTYGVDVLELVDTAGVITPLIIPGANGIANNDSIVNITFNENFSASGFTLHKVTSTNGSGIIIYYSTTAYVGNKNVKWAVFQP